MRLMLRFPLYSLNEFPFLHPPYAITINSIIKYILFIICDFNPRFPRGKRRHGMEKILRVRCISIHASRGGSDNHGKVQRQSGGYFNPRFPRGKRHEPIVQHIKGRKFQSTLPAGEATYIFYTCPIVTDFNPRFPRGKRHLMYISFHLFSKISIHASRGGSDSEPLIKRAAIPIFQSTLPAGEATCGGNHPFNGGMEISIHASRGGSDLRRDSQAS